MASMPTGLQLLEVFTWFLPGLTGIAGTGAGAGFGAGIVAGAGTGAGAAAGTGAGAGAGTGEGTGAPWFRQIKFPSLIAII